MSAAFNSFELEQHSDRGVAADNPASDTRLGMVAALAFFVAFLGWAAFAHLDAAAYAPATVAVAGQRQTVQHRDGGFVGQIAVREGQRVVRGQLLMTLAAAEVRARADALSSQAIRLLAQRARLEAERLGEGTIAEPREFAGFPGESRPEQLTVLRLQQAELAARRQTLAAQRSAFAARASQNGNAGSGHSSQVEAFRRQIRLVDEQLLALRPVAEQGFVSMTRMREIERQRASLEGQLGQYRAGMAQAADARREFRMQSVEAQMAFGERTMAELRDVEGALAELMPQLLAARDQLERTQIRAPATGEVVGLSVFTPGGVITPGQKLMDIVPEDAPLTIAVRISVDDADDLRVGQQATIRFPSLHERRLPIFRGNVARISADSFTDEKTGASYFTGEVEVPARELAAIRAVRGPGFDLRPGMPAEVLIGLRPRTALDYLLEPLVGPFWSALREH